MIINLLYIFLLLVQQPSTEKPSFKGGKAELERFLNQNKIYPEFSKNNCIEGTIEISFQIEANGKVKNAKVSKGLGIDLDKEALRLINLSSGMWQQASDPNAVIIIPINFTLQNYNCEKVGKEVINKSIQAYQVREGLEQAVINYYQNKEKGEVNLKSEAEIIRLKADLGFDDDFVNQKLEEFNKKLKQGDSIGACEALFFIKHIGSSAADKLIAEHCNKSK